MLQPLRRTSHACITLRIPHPPPILDVVRLSLILTIHMFLRIYLERYLIAGKFENRNMAKKKTKQRTLNEVPSRPPTSLPQNWLSSALTSWIVWRSQVQPFLTYSLALRIWSYCPYCREQAIWHSCSFPSELPKARPFVSWVIDYHHIKFRWRYWAYRTALLIQRRLEDSQLASWGRHIGSRQRIQEECSSIPCVKDFGDALTLPNICILKETFHNGTAMTASSLCHLIQR